MEGKRPRQEQGNGGQQKVEELGLAHFSCKLVPRSFGAANWGTQFLFTVPRLTFPISRPIPQIIFLFLVIGVPFLRPPVPQVSPPPAGPCTAL